MFTSEQVDLIRAVMPSWPWVKKLSVDGDGLAAGLQGHPLEHQLVSLGQRGVASLPYFRKGKETVWFTVAPSPEQLRLAIDDLRAWIIPSFGWELEKGAIVSPTNATGQLAPVIIAVSPSGYYRWASARQQIGTVLSKLGLMSELAAGRPVHVLSIAPSLFELRRQFTIALAVMDRDAAQRAIKQIDEHQLDSAANTQFMQVRLWDRFREYEHIAAAPNVDRLVSMRMPHPIRLCIVRAFYEHHIRPVEESGDIAAAAAAYAEKAQRQLSGLISFCKPSDGPEASRCLAYDAWSKRDATAAAVILEESDDELIRRLLSPVAADVPPTVDPVEAFNTALFKGDLRGVQGWGYHLLAVAPETVPPVLEADLPRVLRSSLEIIPNQELSDFLSRAEEPAAEPVSLALPQSWPDFLERLRLQDWGGAEQFLSSPYRPSAGDLDVVKLGQVVETLEDLFTDPSVANDPTGFQIALNSLPVLVEDFVVDPLFPRSNLVDLYLQLFRIWADKRKGSADPPEGNLLLTLASAVLRFTRSGEGEIVEGIRGWWEARKTFRMLPFLSESLELISDLTTLTGAAESLWMDGAGLIARAPHTLTPGERRIWQSIGSRIGFGAAEVNELLGVTETIAEESDPIAEAGLKKVAIVSLQEKAADSAAALIHERTDAQVMVVSELDAGAATDSAKTADVILFVWAANKHAVYRAFDEVRDKLEYVQGTGASSIVLSLERWASRKILA